MVRVAAAPAVAEEEAEEAAAAVATILSMRQDLSRSVAAPTREVQAA